MVIKIRWLKIKRAGFNGRLMRIVLALIFLLPLSACEGIKSLSGVAKVARVPDVNIKPFFDLIQRPNALNGPVRLHCFLVLISTASVVEYYTGCPCTQCDGEGRVALR